MNSFKRGIAKLKLKSCILQLEKYEKYMRKNLSKDNIMYYNGSMFFKIQEFKKIINEHSKLMSNEKVLDKNEK